MKALLLEDIKALPKQVTIVNTGLMNPQQPRVLQSLSGKLKGKLQLNRLVPSAPTHVQKRDATHNDGMQTH